VKKIKVILTQSPSASRWRMWQYAMEWLLTHRNYKKFDAPVTGQENMPGMTVTQINNKETL
jgi:hypothetical protein